MKIKCLLSVAFILSTQYALAQHTLSGYIKDEKNGKELPGVSVYINDLKTGTVSDARGFFKLEGIKKGNYLLEISMVGYKTMVRRMAIDADTSIHSELQPAVAELNNVVVTAVSRSTELMRSPVIIKIADKNDLNEGSSTNLIDALKNVPGISQVTTGAAISKPVIRGLGYNRIITLYNGIRQEGQQWGDEHGVEIDEYAIDKIEIVKGPGSLLYGSDGIAGVVNFIAPKAPAAGTMKTQLISAYQTNNQFIGNSIANSGNKNGLQWLLRMSHKVAGNYKNNYDGRVYNSGFKEYDGSAFLGVNRKWGHAHLHFNSFNNILNLPEGERDSNGRFTFINADGQVETAGDEQLKGFKTGYPYQQVNHLRVSANNYFIFRKGSLNMDLGFQQNKRREFADAANPADIALFFDLSTFNYNLRYHFEEVRGWEFSAGAGGMLQQNQNKGLEFLIPAYGLFDAGICLLTQKTAGKLVFSGGLRFDNRNIRTKQLILDTNGVPAANTGPNTSIKFHAFDKNFNGVSGSAGFSWLMSTASTLKFNVSRGYRAPGIPELASNGRHEGTFRYENGNTKLKSEISHQVDLAFFRQSEHLTLEITPFVNFISNYIYAEKQVDSNGNDIIPDPNDPAPAFQYVQGNAVLRGGELYVDLHPHPLDWLHIENSFSYVRGSLRKQSDSTGNLPFIPPPRYKGELKAERAKAGKRLNNCYIKAGIEYHFAQNKVYQAYATETKTAAYMLLNAGLGANISAFRKKDLISLYVYAANLTNASYQNHLSRLKYAPENSLTGRTGIYNMGRNFSVKTILNF